MTQANPTQKDDEYGIAGWYSATRDSTTTSIMSEDPNIILHQIATRGYPQRQRAEMKILNPPMRQAQQYDDHLLHPNQQSSTQQYQQQPQPQPRPHQPPHQQQREQRETADPSAIFFAESPENMYFSAQPHGHNHTSFGQDYYNNSYPQQNYSQQHYPQQRSDWPRNDSNVLAIEDLPRGVTSASRDEPPFYRPTTATTGHSAYTMGSYYRGMYSKPSQNDMLGFHGKYTTRDEMSAIELNNASTVYSPPLPPPTASTTQYSAPSLSRDKSFKDRYKPRKAGGDSGTGECCGPCCDGCMGFLCCSCCSCCTACGCIGPFLAWALLILVLAGAALALYFNWSKITDAIDHTSESSASSAASQTQTTAAHAARDLFHLVSTTVGPLVEDYILPTQL